MYIDEVSGESVRIISEESCCALRDAARSLGQLPAAYMAPIGLGGVSLAPGETAVLPVQWTLSQLLQDEQECSTHGSALLARCSKQQA